MSEREKAIEEVRDIVQDAVYGHLAEWGISDKTDRYRGEPLRLVLNKACDPMIDEIVAALCTKPSPCVCGSPPNPDCERCQLVAERDELKAKWNTILRASTDPNWSEFVTPEVYQVIERIKSKCCRSLLREACEHTSRIADMAKELGELKAENERLKAELDALRTRAAAVNPPAPSETVEAMLKEIATSSGTTSTINALKLAISALEVCEQEEPKVLGETDIGTHRWPFVTEVIAVLKAAIAAETRVVEGLPGEAEPISPEIAAKLVKPTPDQPFPRVTIPADQPPRPITPDLIRRCVDEIAFYGYFRDGQDGHAALQVLRRSADTLAEAEKRASDAETFAKLLRSQYASIATASVKLRDDNGPTGELGEPRQYIACPDGQYRELAVVQSAPGLRAEQLEIEP